MSSDQSNRDSRHVLIGDRTRAIPAVMHYLDDREVAAQIGAREPAFWGSYRSHDLCATAACEPRPLPGNRARSSAPFYGGVPHTGLSSVPSVTWTRSLPSAFTIQMLSFEPPGSERVKTILSPSADQPGQ